MDLWRKSIDLDFFLWIKNWVSSRNRIDFEYGARFGRIVLNFLALVGTPQFSRVVNKINSLRADLNVLINRSNNIFQTDTKGDQM